MKYRKKPVVIEAFCFGRDVEPDWFRSDAKRVAVHGSVPGMMMAEIRTMEGVMTAAPGDWIIQGVKGEIYPCKDDIFRQTYEAAE